MRRHVYYVVGSSTLLKYVLVSAKSPLIILPSINPKYLMLLCLLNVCLVYIIHDLGDEVRVSAQRDDEGDNKC